MTGPVPPEPVASLPQPEEEGFVECASPPCYLDEAMRAGTADATIGLHDRPQKLYHLENTSPKTDTAGETSDNSGPRSAESGS